MLNSADDPWEEGISLHYSYGEETPGWKPERKKELAKRLRSLVAEFMANQPKTPARAPYVEVDILRRDSVLIRNTTDLSQEMIEKLTSHADGVYREVMGLKSEEVL